jgi:hypothetical protein
VMLGLGGRAEQIDASDKKYEILRRELLERVSLNDTVVSCSIHSEECSKKLR